MQLCAGFYSAALNGCDVPPQEQSTLNSVMAETAVLNCFKVTEWKRTGWQMSLEVSSWQYRAVVAGCTTEGGDHQHPSTFGDF